MTLRRRRPLIAAAATLTLMTSIAACSLGGSTDGSGDTTGDETGDGGGGDLVVAGPIPIENLDPHGAASMDAGTQLAARAIFSQLLVSTGQGEFDGELAESWESNDDASVWTFALRAGVTYSDGSPVTADDVVASFERVLAAEGPLAGNFGGYTVAAPDDATVVFTSPTPDAAFLGKISSFFVTPAGAAEDGFFSDPVGSGPFLVESFEPGATLRLSPNPDYWDGEPEIASLELQSIPETAARMTALQTGEVDITWSMPDDQIAELRTNAELTVETVPSPGVFTMWFNSSTPALEDPAVRRALWQAVDFEEIIASLYPETGTPADAPVSPTVLGYAPQEPVAYDPDAARAALEAAGFDFENTVLRWQFSQASFRNFMNAVVSDLAEIGVTVEPLEKEQAVFLEDLLALNWDMNMQQLGSQGYDAATNLGRLYTCEANRMGYCNPELDDLLAAAGSTSDTAEREDLYAQATEIIWNDAVGMYPMFVETPYAWQNRVEGFTPVSDGIPYFDEVTVSGD
ncbi:extracellular solute-binding protein family 5 [Beutenbergia cavernae DSM 12333]|uniref:Extracellular solute-binding protein family 5 n=1 Tax=Beutenbergia cavernae (strain ATCC BAA-8 / DSM 12333 / CCUG 43141 / JCM 11478 / NBRC 16432 / NCIMB 13614 / HKI 0122) TaxID=471853 RepID=C5C266_BEUC1|nr:ABC transporter substrate-binding protein [Beutenbergia cavernae]ACQ81691.1 extracellular solute-binding protein family 5 [Beutenbergia cavernae DSM 12333]